MDKTDPADGSRRPRKAPKAQVIFVLYVGLWNLANQEETPMEWEDKILESLGRD